MTDARIAALPERTRHHLEALQAMLRETLGDRLRALLVYGSVARGGYDAERSDVDLVLVLTDDDRSVLQEIGQALELARHAARIEAILLRADELQRAADVFPLLYDDIRGCSIPLHGDNPFASLEILDEHRRLRIEQELREARIRLRRALVEATGAPRTLAGAVERKLKQLRSPLHALLRLRGVTVDDGRTPVLAACAKRWKLELGALARAREDAPAAHDALVKLLDAAIADVDDNEGGK
jgi:predicted nucleotidyltransferase